MEDPSWQEQSPRVLNVLETLKQASVEKSTSKCTLVPTWSSSTHLPLKLRLSLRLNMMPSSPRTIFPYSRSTPRRPQNPCPNLHR
ncbi:hypothetical protein WN944_025545 [Citrus x changshan-huyou]|uniref:Uncharacterized protein n=1 Tax=Citrus x changshan-huyou TaxID=2935761 RepID=A0AAP0LQK3_9ROSI